MPFTTISNLPTLSTVTGTEKILVSNGVGTFRTSVNNISGASISWSLYNPAVPIQSNDRLIIDTRAGPVTVTLPVGVNGESIGFLDGYGTFSTNNLIINSSAGETFLGTASPLTHSVSQTLILTSVNADWRF